MPKPIREVEIVLHGLMDSIESTIRKNPVSTLNELTYEIASEFLRRHGGSMVYLPKQSQLLQEKRLHEVKSVLEKVSPELRFLVTSYYGISGIQARNILNGNA
jgi:hypothetical protein